MAPAVGPTAAFAMCAAAFVGWRKPPLQISEIPEVPDSINDNTDINLLVSDSHNTASICESAFLDIQIWQNASLNSTSVQGLVHSEGFAHPFEKFAHSPDGFGHPERFAHPTEGFAHLPVGCAHPPVRCAHPPGGYACYLAGFAHPSEDSFNDEAIGHPSKDGLGDTVIASALINHDNGGAILDESDNFIAVVNGDSEEKTIALDNESFTGQKSASRCDQSTCTSMPSGTVEATHSDDFTVFSAGTKLFDHNEEFSRVKDFTTSAEVADSDSIRVIQKMPSDLVETILDITALSSMQPYEQTLTDHSMQGKEQASSFPDMQSDMFEFMLGSWQALCQECQMLAKASKVLHQQRQAWLATSRSALGEDFVSSALDNWWMVISFASLCDMVILGVFGRFVARNIPSCCRCRRREPVQTELHVAVTMQNKDAHENLMTVSDEQKEIPGLNAGRAQLHAPIRDDVPCEIACGRPSADSGMKGQGSPFNSAIIATPQGARRVIVGQGSCAIGQNTVATGVAVQRA